MGGLNHWFNTFREMEESNNNDDQWEACKRDDWDNDLGPSNLVVDNQHDIYKKFIVSVYGKVNPVESVDQKKEYIATQSITFAHIDIIANENAFAFYDTETWRHNIIFDPTPVPVIDLEIDITDKFIMIL
jgi:hypothetical protein